MPNSNIQPLNLDEMTSATHNVYKTVAVLGKRANQVAAKIKQELNDKLADFATTGDSLEEVVENREQIEIAKYYEALPKPTLLAIEEFVRGEVTFKDAATEEVL